MKVLFIVPYPTEGPSNRYRVEQYLPLLEKEGISCAVRPFVSSALFKILYKPGKRLEKAAGLIDSVRRRLLDLTGLHRFDVIFVHIESFPFGPAVFEWIFAKLGKPVIYDFEDAVYLPDFRGNNKLINYLRCPDKFYRILRLSSHIIVCNKEMDNLVRRYNPNVTVIPTSIDTEKFRVKDRCAFNKEPVLGWIGSHTTAYCLRQLEKVFLRLAERYDFCLKIVGAGNNFRLPGVKIVQRDWSLQNDVENFQSLDIGIYPLPFDERSRAKTPFKTIQYMSVGVPCVVSRVGGNPDIIQDGVNGFLASTDEEWFNRLSLLLENAALREKLGLQGRKTVEEKYSLKAGFPKFLGIMRKVYNKEK